MLDNPRPVAEFTPGETPVFETVVDFGQPTSVDFNIQNPSIIEDDDIVNPPLVDPNDDADDNDDQNNTDDSDNNEDYEDYSDVAVWFKNLQKKGEFPADIEIPKDATYDQIEEKHVEYLSSITEQIRDQYIEQLGEVGEYVNFILEGGDPSILNGVARVRQLAAIPIDETEDGFSENNREILVYNYLLMKGLPEEDAKELIDNYKDTSKLSTKSQEARHFFKEQEISIIQNHKLEQQKEQERQQVLMEQSRQHTIGIINKGNIGGVQLTKQEQIELQKAMFDPTEIIQLEDEHGKTRRMRVTKIQALQYELQNDIEKQLLVAKLMLDGFKPESFKRQAKVDTDNEMLRILNSRTGNKQARQPKPNSRNGWIVE
jgi:hypothetical protein